MSHCTVPVTTVSNQVSFSLIWFPGVKYPFKSHTRLGFCLLHAFREKFYLITSFVKFQADVATDDRSIGAECRVLVNTQSHCLGCDSQAGRQLFHTHSLLHGGACKSFWSASLKSDAHSSPTPPLSLVTPLVTHWGVPQRAPVSQNIVMRILIVYDSTSCAHQGFQGVRSP